MEQTNLWATMVDFDLGQGFAILTRRNFDLLELETNDPVEQGSGWTRLRHPYSVRRASSWKLQYQEDQEISNLQPDT